VLQRYLGVTSYAAENRRRAGQGKPAEFGEALSQGPYWWTQTPSLLKGDVHGIPPLPWNVLPSLPPTLSPAQVPIRPMEDPARTATSLLAAAPPLPLEAAGLRQASERHWPLDAREGHRLLGLRM
jgi:hypothetical protein